MAAKKNTIEDSFKEIEEIIEKMEDSETSLDENIKLYDKGIRLLKKCSESLDMAEKKIIVLQTDEEE